MSFPSDGICQPEPGYIELAGGWSIPKDQMPGWPFDRLLIPIRGGMKYPTPTQETHTMTDMNPGYNAEPEINLDLDDLDTLTQMRNQLDALIREKQDQIKKRKIPSAPPLAARRFTIGVKFHATGTAYEFLIYRAPQGKGWYTTGQGERAYYASWRALVEWLRSPDVYWHGPLFELTIGERSHLAAERPNE